MKNLQLGTAELDSFHVIKVDERMLQWMLVLKMEYAIF